MVATTQEQSSTDDGIQLSDVYRLSVDQYHQMISPGILHDSDPAELLEGLLLRKWPTRFSDAPDAMHIGEFYPLSVQQYQQMGSAGVLSEDDRVELLEGVIFKRMPILPPHTGTVIRLTDILKSKLPMGWRYRQEQPVVLTDGEPMPDGAVATGTNDDNFRFHPPGQDVALVIEVSDTTLNRDRGIKLRSYARAGIVCYWIVNLIDRQIEVCTQPDPSAVPPTYRSIEIFKPADAVPFKIGDQTIAAVRVADILPTV